MTFNFCLRQLAMIVLSVVGEECLGIWVTHESINASGLSGALVASGQSCVWGLAPDRLHTLASFHTVLSVVLTETTILFALGCIRKFAC